MLNIIYSIYTGNTKANSKLSVISSSTDKNLVEIVPESKLIIADENYRAPAMIRLSLLIEVE